MDTLGARNINVVTLFVEDLESTVAFYEKVFGLRQVFGDEHSAVFDFGNMSINLLQSSEAPGLIEPGKVAEPGSGSRFQFTIRVEDVEAVCEELREQGVELLNGPVDRPWGVRTACFADPGGHVWEIAQELSGQG
ncbi:VOC family protein [Saccharibacillus sp. CPCC 101409]|uniref:VOC family protein n=1 Tax=Saccharibacillus sp. CPCC 101409 TaxID=3058041 RepID=UPI0026736D11|nr:VOC family protein [Saccharibacillus sp. CPCC 101409]MDO3409782.1 VOC family protein [Saccharibacillus sp. CPCC 101409]